MNVTFFSLLNALYINNVNVNEAQKHNGDPNIHLHYITLQYGLLFIMPYYIYCIFIINVVSFFLLCMRLILFSNLMISFLCVRFPRRKYTLAQLP